MSGSVLARLDASAMNSSNLRICASDAASSCFSSSSDSIALLHMMFLFLQLPLYTFAVDCITLK